MTAYVASCFRGFQVDSQLLVFLRSVVKLGHLSGCSGRWVWVDGVLGIGSVLRDQSCLSEVHTGFCLYFEGPVFFIIS